MEASFDGLRFDQMPTPRETILTALHARLMALPATALRGEVLPERVPGQRLPPSRTACGTRAASCYETPCAQSQGQSIN